MLNKESIIEKLKSVKYPGYSRDIVSFGLVKDVVLAPGKISVTVQFTSANDAAQQQVKHDCENAVKSIPEAKGADIQVNVLGPAQAGSPAGGQSPWANQSKIPGLKRIVAVASGKGGVGKSTVSVNLACALRHLGSTVGLLDCDIYGPTIPLMMGIHERPTISEDEKMVPPANFGVKLMSIGFLLDGDQPVIWRGPMIVKTIQQFFHAVQWGELDYLLVDLPPGTGDAQLTLCQTVPLDGGVVVTTPQEASLGVVRKGIAMFEKVNVPILGLIENMSYFTAPGGQRIDIFGHGGGQAEATRQKLTFLGEIPIYPEIRIGGDQGLPVVVSNPETPYAKDFIGIAERLRAKIP